VCLAGPAGGGLSCASKIQEFPGSWYLRSSGKRGLAIENEYVLVMRESRSKDIVLVLEPSKLGLQVADALLETAHFGDHTRVGTADVAE
jgi:hypothetical protein